MVEHRASSEGEGPGAKTIRVEWEWEATRGAECTKSHFVDEQHDGQLGDAARAARARVRAGQLHVEALARAREVLVENALRALARVVQPCELLSVQYSSCTRTCITN